VEISCQKDVFIVGRGENATIAVEGSLQVHGVSAREVIFENVTVEPAAVCEDVHLDMCKFRKSGGVKTPKDGRTEGKLFIENVQFEHDTHFDVTIARGSIDLSSTSSQEVVTIRGVDVDGSPNKVKIKIRGCSGSLTALYGGLEITGCDDVTVRLNAIRGVEDRVYLADNATLTFDGNKVVTRSIELRQSAAGGFAKTKLQKCDIYCETVSAFAPRVGNQRDHISVDKCWFKGIVKPGEVEEKVFKDGADDPENGAYLSLKKINERPLELSGAIER
jgi:hypothetical protein